MTEFQIGDKLRGFKFGTYTFNIINKLTGTKTTEEVFERLQQGSSEFTAAFYNACAQHWTLARKEEIDFTELDVVDWLDELGGDETSRLTTELVNTYISKKVTAPKAGQLQYSNGVTSGS